MPERGKVWKPPVVWMVPTAAAGCTARMTAPFVPVSPNWPHCGGMDLSNRRNGGLPLRRQERGELGMASRTPRPGGSAYLTVVSVGASGPRPKGTGGLARVINAVPRIVGGREDGQGFFAGGGRGDALMVKASTSTQAVPVRDVAAWLDVRSIGCAKAVGDAWRHRDALLAGWS